MGGPTRVAAALLSLCAALPALAIETDQYYAWGKQLDDSTDVLNAKVNLEIDLALRQVNARRSRDEKTCHYMTRQILARFRLFIFHELELWANNTSLVDRVPSTPDEELQYRKRYLYHNAGPLDVGTWMPPSPTIELNGVQIGTDKLTHFFSEGWWYYKWYRKQLRRGLSPEEAEQTAIRRGLLVERTLLGMTSSGVLSVADLEANYQGMLFLQQLCDVEDPLLERTDDGWRLAEPFDFRRYVTPEWDESYQPSVFGKRRWKRVLPVLREYCPMLERPEVQRRRRDYRARDEVTTTERYLRRLVDKGKLEDPAQFSIERVCDD